MVVPTVASVPTPSVLVDGVGTASLIPYYVLATVNPGDSVEGATRLKSGYPDVVSINMESSIEIASDEPITSICLIAVGNTSAGPATAAPANYTGNAYIIANTDSALGNWETGMCTFAFDSTDVVERVRITVTPVIGSNYCRISVEGMSYA